MSRFRQKPIITIVRVLSKPLAVLLAGTFAAPGHAMPTQTEVAPAKRTLSAFFDEIGGDEALRARFAQSPRETLAEHGLDLPDFALPDRFTDIEIDRLLTQWPALINPTRPAWGRSASDHVHRDEVAEQPRVSVPMPVYGPPPRVPRKDNVQPPPRASNPVPKNKVVPAPVEKAPSDQRR